MGEILLLVLNCQLRDYNWTKSIIKLQILEISGFICKITTSLSQKVAKKVYDLSKKLENKIDKIILKIFLN